MDDITRTLLQASYRTRRGYPCAAALPTWEMMTHADHRRDYERFAGLVVRQRNYEAAEWHALMKAGGFDFGEPELLDVEAEVERKVAESDKQYGALHS